MVERFLHAAGTECLAGHDAATGLCVGGGGPVQACPSCLDAELPGVGPCSKHNTTDREAQAMGQDRTDEIRAAVVQARMRGWAAQLAYAEQLLAVDDGNAPLARAVIASVQREVIGVPPRG